MVAKKTIVFPWEGLVAALLAWLLEWLTGRDEAKRTVQK